MKLVMDEKVKHRLIGLAVILSIGAIFAPAIMKKSNQRLDGNVSVSVELPPKPSQPKVAISDEKAMFAAVKVAHVELPEFSESEPLASTIAKAEPLSPMNQDNIKAASVIAKAEMPIVKKITPMASAPSIKPVAKATVTHKAVAPPAAKTVKTVAKNNKAVKPVAKTNYAVQLALFSKQQNAQSLVTKLRGKGYKAAYNKIQTREGTAYKVLVGPTKEREQAQRLKQQIASVMQIKGFVVTTTG